MMPKLIILGSSSAIPTREQANTHMLLQGTERTILIDCVDSMIGRLDQIGLDQHSVTDLFLTHFHPDHVAGVPGFLMSMWLLERRLPLHIYGLSSVLENTIKMLDLYQWRQWPGFFAVEFHQIPETEHYLALECDEFRIITSPVRHMVPAIGMRIDFVKQERALAYSCDTSPCEEVIRMAAGVDLLIHEATGQEYGHTSASQAGSVARQAEAGKLVLIHYSTLLQSGNHLLAQAEASFGGPVVLARDLMEFEF
jgi:ribonuclease Z